MLVSYPDPSPEKRKEGLVFRATFLVTWGGGYGVKNIIIAFPCILDLVLDFYVFAYNYAFCNRFELSDRGAVLTGKVAQSTRPSFSHVRGGARDYSGVSLVPRPLSGTRLFWGLEAYCGMDSFRGLTGSESML